MAIQIITNSLPQGVIGVAYSQTVQTFGGTAPLTFSKPSGTLPTGLSLNTSTGNIHGTPTTAGVYTFTILVTDDDSATSSQAYSVHIYAALNTAPDPIDPATSVVLEAGTQQQFTATGGSGSYVWSVNGGNLINPFTGVLTAVNGGSYTVTLTDSESGQIATVPITITAQSQFCVSGEMADTAAVSGSDACCEFNVECGDRLQLRIPSFHIVEDGIKTNILYTDPIQVVTGEAAALRSVSAGAGASGNEVSFNRDAYLEIVTSADMADTAKGEFALGWASNFSDADASSIDHAVVFFTSGSDRQVELRHGGSVEADSQFAIAQGDAVTFGVISGELQLWINSVKVFTSTEDYSTCGNPKLAISMETSGTSLGGYVAGLTWTVQTVGSAPEVGSIDADGVYSSPITPIAGVVKVSATVGTANFYVNVRNIQPTPKFVKAQPFLAGGRAHVWVTNKKATDMDIIRIASDGSPDALQNPGMIYLGVLEGSANFSETITYQNFDNDEGTYFTAVSAEKATLTGTFLEVRDYDKLALLMQHATLQPTAKGVREISVGGKGCGACDLRAVLVVESGSCGSGWDVIYLPRVKNNANLTLDIGKKTNAKYSLNFEVLTDPTRPIGKQLYSIYQMENCTDTNSATSCD